MSIYADDEFLPNAFKEVLQAFNNSKGIAPAVTTDCAGEMMVKLDIITSSPLPIPKAFIAISNAAQPLLTAIPCACPIYCENLFSNSEINGPSLLIQLVVIHIRKIFKLVSF